MSSPDNERGTDARIVVVTGSAGGIGSAIADRFNRHGDIVIGLDKANGHDLSTSDRCVDLVTAVVREHGRIDVLVNCAGIMRTGDLVTSSEQDWAEVFAVNVFATARISREVLRHMRSARSGVIVNMASVAGELGYPNRAAYAASKGAVLALTRAMAADEAGSGIRVCAVSPGSVDGPMNERIFAATPDATEARRAAAARAALGRMATADEVAAAVHFLASADAFITGVSLLVDGGMVTTRT